MPIAISQDKPGNQFHFSSITQMVEVRAQETPDFPIIAVPDRNFQFHRYTYRDIDDGANRLAHHYTSLGVKPRSQGDATSSIVTAMLAPSSIDYAINELAFAKMGHTTLFLSTNNSVPALTHLLKATGATTLVVHPSLIGNAKEAIAELAEDAANQSCQLVDIAEKSRWDNDESVKPYPRALTPEQEGPLPVFIVHSSGSTGFPKPIILSHKASAYNFSGTGFGLQAFTTLPLYHNHGPIHGRKLLSLFPSELPLTTANITSALENADHTEGFYVVPYVLKLLGESEAGIRLLQAFKIVTYGGAACPDELGDRLVREHGVRLVGHYGMTEVGQLGTSLRDFETDKDWNYVRFSGPHVSSGVIDYLKFEPQADGSFELVVLDGWGGKVRSNRPDNSYSSSDLFVPHPSIEGAYKFIGRIDDTLTLVNGEKCQPTGMELSLKGDSPYISEAIVFGIARPHIGALLLPTDKGAELLKEEDGESKFFHAIWPIIEKANVEAPSHGKLLPEMLIVLPVETKLPRADKASIIRPKVYKMFESEINDIYARYEKGEAYIPGQKVTKQKLIDINLEDYLLEKIGRFSKSSSPLELDTDFFEFGIDSLQAAVIRSTIQKELDLGGKTLSSNIVFENPTVNQLASYLNKVVSGDDSQLSKEESQMAKMQELVAKYSNFAEMPASKGRQTDKRTVVLTGATGSLGAHLLDQLLNQQDVERVICLVRAKNDEDALRRVEESLQIRSLPSLSQREEKAVVAYPSDLSLSDLGLGQQRYEEVRNKVTDVIANAWAVNFTLNVESFENGNIKAIYNLLNLAITSHSGAPANLFFSSSISAVAAHTGPVNAEAVSANPADAQSMGYARSKWVAENMVALAAQTRGIRSESLRIGQMVGDTLHGVWNETEAIPLQLKSAQTIGAMPDLDETLSWLPVDLAAKSIMEVMYCPRHQPLWHILNSSTQTSWPTVWKALKVAGIDFEVVSKREWIIRLRKSNPDVTVNPTYKLVDFFGNKYDHDIVAKRAFYSTEQTAKASPTIASAPFVDENVVVKFVEAWRKRGFLL
ncbi:hypothetical protein QFC22_006525 [Naganishia vaughanmartiniae]|uniref:Uncharacterized protein n=1 Tax=Naganishia vaughanmartiniae TaxID=1424756 RepID=A0ACC2WJC6_9TREE|nr:hypothetical protein QFC22_006525 [Naganishia vaughanmartiniae]